MAHSDRVVIVTGAGRGIGLACARHFARHNARVIVADVDEETGRSACEDITANGGEALFVRADVGERLHIHNMVAATLEAYGRIDVLINNAAIRANQDFFSITDDDWDQVMRVNLRGPFLTSQAVAKQMITQIEGDETAPSEGGGYSIVNISSVDAIMTRADQIPFAVSKGGLNQLTKVLALSLAPHGIRVNAIGPGSIMTEGFRGESGEAERRKTVAARTPLGRIGSPDEVAGIAYFLASDEAGYITGQCIYADGGRLIQDYSANKKGRGE